MWWESMAFTKLGMRHMMRFRRHLMRFLRHNDALPCTHDAFSLTHYEFPQWHDAVLARYSKWCDAD